MSLSLALALVLVLAAGVGSWSAASQVVTTEHVHVVFDDPELEFLARHVAATAENALAVVAELFGVEPFAVSFTLTDTTDVFNALATPVPRPTVALRAAPPTEARIGLDAASWLELLIIHELTHLAHFTQTDAPAYGLGFVGDGLAIPPPLWLVEGLATWVESEATRGGRRDDALTKGMLATLAGSETWPTLAEAGTATNSAWPGGDTRYRLGAVFLDRLIREHGWETVVAVIEAFNRAPPTQPFAAVWSDVTGSDLYVAWEDWRAHLAADAQARADRLSASPAQLTHSGWHTGLPVASPSGDRLAWRTWPAAIAVADLTLDEDGDVLMGTPATHATGRFIGSLDWLDAHTLVYTRIHRTITTAWSEVFLLDLGTGRETRLTTGARAHFARAAPGRGCVMWVRAGATATSAVMRSCGGGTAEAVWEAQPHEQITGFDVSADGRMVVSVWRQGLTGLAVLEAMPAVAQRSPTQAGGQEHTATTVRYRPRFLTWDAFQDLAPVWTEGGNIRFRSDRTERFEIYEIDPGSGGAQDAEIQLVQLTASLGGSFEVADPGVVVALGADGFDLARLPAAPVDVLSARLQVRTGPEPPPLAGSARPYSPWPTLAPFGWLPSRAALSQDPLGVTLEAVVYGRDASGAHGYDVTLGVDTSLAGPLGPAYASARYLWQPAGIWAAAVPTPAYTLTAELGMWPHAPHLARTVEVATGARGTAIMRLRADDYAAAAALRFGVVYLPSRSAVLPDIRLDASLATAGADRWGYPGAGAQLGLAGRWTPTSDGTSAGAWVDGAIRTEALGGAIAASLRAGYRQQPPVPVALSPVAVTLGLEGRWSVPLAWRWGDGRYAWERVTVAPAVRAWSEWGDASGGHGGSPGGAAGSTVHAGFGADVALGADLLVNYAVPVTLTARAGWSERFWWGVGLGVRR